MRSNYKNLQKSIMQQSQNLMLLMCETGCAENHQNQYYNSDKIICYKKKDASNSHSKIDIVCTSF